MLCGCEREFSDREVFRIEGSHERGKKSGDTNLELGVVYVYLSPLCQREGEITPNWRHN